MSSKQVREIIRYSNSFKLMLVHEAENGHSVAEIRKKYDISGTSTIQRWIRKYGRHHLLNKVVRIETMNEKDQLKKLIEENKLLKQKLAETYVAKDCLEELIKLADKEYKTDLKKNFGTRSATDSQADTA